MCDTDSGISCRGGGELKGRGIRWVLWSPPLSVSTVDVSSSVLSKYQIFILISTEGYSCSVHEVRVVIYTVSSASLREASDRIALWCCNLIHEPNEPSSFYRYSRSLEFAKSQRAVENRRKWRKLVAKSSVVPQRPSRLRDRWDEKEMRVGAAAVVLIAEVVVMIMLFCYIDNRIISTNLTTSPTLRWCGRCRCWLSNTHRLPHQNPHRHSLVGRVVWRPSVWNHLCRWLQTVVTSTDSCIGITAKHWRRRRRRRRGGGEEGGENGSEQRQQHDDNNNHDKTTATSRGQYRSRCLLPVISLKIQRAV